MNKERFELNVDEVVALLAIFCFFFWLFACTGCGGGQATAEEIAQHDTDVQAMALQHKTMTIQPPDCSQGACK